MLRFFFANLFALFFVTVFIVACGGPELNSGKTTVASDRPNPWDIPGENNEDKSKVKPLSTQTGSSSEEKGWATATDSLGNVYVTGSTSGIMPNASGLVLVGTEYYLIKYNSAGTKIWTRQFGTVLNDESTAIVVDTSDNIYVCGHTQSSLYGTNSNIGTWDPFVAKYSADGTLQWGTQWGTNQSDYCNAITVDASGNTYVAGTTLGIFGGNGTRYDGFVSKIGPNGGTPLWTQQWGVVDQPDGAYGVAVTSDGFVYVGGDTLGVMPNCNPSCTSSGGFDNVLLKYSTSGGSPLWIKQWGSTPAANEYIYSLAVDNLNNLYMSGATDGTLYGTAKGGYDMFAVKFAAGFNAGSNAVWSTHLGSSASETMSQVAVEFVATNLYNVYIAGETTGAYDGQTAIGGTDFYTTKFAVTNNSPNVGTKIWSKLKGSIANDETKSIALDKNSNIYVAGHTTGSLYGNNAGAGDMFLYKDAGEIAHYRLENDVTDTMGNYNGDGIYNGASYSNGYIGYGVALNGVASIVNLAEFNPRNTSDGTYSISMWVNPGSGGYTQHTYIDKQLSNSTVDNIFSVEHNKSTNTLYVKIRTATLTCSNVTEDTGNWTHFAFLMNESPSLTYTYVSVYKNGQLLTCSGSPLNIKIGATITGKYWLAGGKWATNSSLTNLFDGMVDDIRFYNKKLKEQEVADLSMYPQIDDTYSNSDILAKYNLESNTIDSTGHGFASGSSSVTYVEGQENYAAKFNGTSSFADLGNFDVRNGGDSYAISIWIKPEYGSVTTVPDHSYLSLNSASAGNTDLINFGVYGNYLKVFVRSAVLTIYQSEPQNVWTHYALSFLEKAGQTFVTIYRNGVSINSVTLNAAIGSETSFLPWSIGYKWDGSARAKFFKGQIDHVRFYSRQLSLNDAKDLFQYDNSMVYCSDINLGGRCMRSAGTEFDLSQKYWFIRSGNSWVFPKTSVNDSVSSVKLAKNWEAYLCQDSNHNGTCKYFNSTSMGGTSYSSMVTYSFNDTASSFTVQPLNFEKAKEYYGFRNIGDTGSEPQGFAYFYENQEYQKPAVPVGPKRLFMVDKLLYDIINDTTNTIIKSNLISSVELYGNVIAKLYDSTLLDTDEHAKTLKTSHRNFDASNFNNPIKDCANCSWYNTTSNEAYNRYSALDFRHYENNVRKIILNPDGDPQLGSIGWFEASDLVDDSGHLDDLCLMGANSTNNYRIECNRVSGPDYGGSTKYYNYISMDSSVSSDEYYMRVTDTEYLPSFSDKSKFRQYGDNFNLLFLQGHGSFWWIDGTDPNSEYPNINEPNWNYQSSIVYRDYFGVGNSGKLLNSGIGRDNFSPANQGEFTDGEWNRVIGQQATKWLLTVSCQSMGNWENQDPPIPQNNSYEDRINAWKYPLERLHGVGGIENNADMGRLPINNYDNFWVNLTTNTVSEAFIDSWYDALPNPEKRARYLTRESCDCTHIADPNKCTSYMNNEYFYGVNTGPLSDKGDLSGYPYYCWREYGLETFLTPSVPQPSKTLSAPVADEFPLEAYYYEQIYDDESDIKKSLKLDDAKTTDYQKGTNDRKLTENNIVYSENSFYLFKGRNLVPAGLKLTTQELDKAHHEEAFNIAKTLSNLPLQLDGIAKDEISSYMSDDKGTLSETGRLLNKIKYSFSAILDGLPIFGDNIEVDYDGAGLYKLKNSLPSKVKQGKVIKLKTKVQTKGELVNLGAKEADVNNGKLMYAKDGLGYLRPALVYTDSASQESKIYFIDGGE